MRNSLNPLFWDSQLFEVISKAAAACG